MSSTRISRRVNAPRAVVYRALLEVVEFETTDPALQGEMTITIALADADGGTEVLAVHDGLPPPDCRPPITRPAGGHHSAPGAAAVC